MSTNTLKQALEIVYGDIKNINKRVKNLESAGSGVLYNETTKSAVAYQDNVSANACPYALLNILGGMSYENANLIDISAYVGANPQSSRCSYSLSNDVLTITASGADAFVGATVSNGSDYTSGAGLKIKVKPNTTYTISVNDTFDKNFITHFDSNNVSLGFVQIGNSSSFTTTESTDYITIRFGVSSSVSGSNYSTTIMLNEGSTALPYQPYFEGIRDTATTSAILSGANLLNVADNSSTTSGVSVVSSGGITTINGTTTASVNKIISLLDLDLPAGTYTLSTLNTTFNWNNIGGVYIGNGEWNNVASVGGSAGYTTFTLTETTHIDRVRFYANSGTTFNNVVLKIMLVKGSTAPTVYKPYMTPITKTIPQEIQALTGYGWGINDTCYNYIDFANKKFIQKVGTRAYQSGDEEDTSVLTDLTITYYELATPVETDISSYLPDDFNSIQIEPNGTITFDNTYQQAIPYEYLYLEKVGANNE